MATVVKPESRVRVGDELLRLGRELALTNEEVDALFHDRDRAPAMPVNLP